MTPNPRLTTGWPLGFCLTVAVSSLVIVSLVDAADPPSTEGGNPSMNETSFDVVALSKWRFQCRKMNLDRVHECQMFARGVCDRMRPAQGCSPGQSDILGQVTEWLERRPGWSAAAASNTEKILLTYISDCLAAIGPSSEGDNSAGESNNQATTTTLEQSSLKSRLEQEELANLRRENQQFRGELEQVRANERQLQAELDGTPLELEQVRENERKLQTELDGARLELEQVRANEPQLRAQLDGARLELEQVHANERQLQAELEQVRAKM